VCVCGGCFEFFLGVVNIYIYSRLPLCLLGIAMFLFLVRFDGRGGELGWWGSSFFFFFFFWLFRSREGCVEMGLGGGGMLWGFEKMGRGEGGGWMLVVL